MKKKKIEIESPDTPEKLEALDLEAENQETASPEQEEVVFDCTAQPEASEEALLSQIDQLKTELQESNNSLLRSMADFDNFRKRQRDDVARQISLAKENLLVQVVDVLDNLERALAASEENKDPQTLFDGLTLIAKQIQDLLTRAGVDPIEAKGQLFDPELHEAMMRTHADDHPENTVVEEFEKGYTFDGKVLRPSKVMVAVDS